MNTLWKVGFESSNQDLHNISLNSWVVKIRIALKHKLSRILIMNFKVKLSFAKRLRFESQKCQESNKFSMLFYRL